MERLSPPPPAHRACATHTEDNWTVLALWGFDALCLWTVMFLSLRSLIFAQEETALVVGEGLIAP